MCQTLNRFIESASHPPGWDQAALDRAQIRVISSLDLACIPSDLQRPYEFTPEFPFAGCTPQTINNVVKSEFPGTPLNCILFIILDSFSIEDGTCIIAQNTLREDPFLMLVRSRWEDAMMNTVSTTCTGMNFEVLTAHAMLKLRVRLVINKLEMPFADPCNRVNRFRNEIEAESLLSISTAEWRLSLVFLRNGGRWIKGLNESQANDIGA